MRLDTYLGRKTAAAEEAQLQHGTITMQHQLLRYLKEDKSACIYLVSATCNSIAPALKKSHEYPFAGDIVYVRSHEPLL